jgi:hypothetical protein
MARPTIGDFRGAEQNKPRPPPPPEPGEKEEEAETPEAPKEAEATAGTALPDLDFLTPAEKYRERLKGMKIDLKEAEGIYDAVLSKGYYEEYVRLRGNRRAVFRTRAYEDHLRLQTVLEMQKPQLAISQDELITRYNLAASLFEWDGKPLKHDTDEDFDALLLLLRRLPGPLFSVLARELSKFDTKIMAVFDEGADENF